MEHSYNNCFNCSCLLIPTSLSVLSQSELVDLSTHMVYIFQFLCMSGNFLFDARHCVSYLFLNKRYFLILINIFVLGCSQALRNVIILSDLGFKIRQLRQGCAQPMANYSLLRRQDLSEQATQCLMNLEIFQLGQQNQALFPVLFELWALLPPIPPSSFPCYQQFLLY